MAANDLGRYRLIERLGAGGMGEVFLARLDGEDGFSRRLVIKRILPEFSGNERFREMFAAEARIAASLNHPNIIQVTDFGRIDTNCFLAMEFVDGTDLATLIDSAQRQRLRLPLDFILALGLGCLRALGYAHRREPPVVHGDVSPGNILVGREGDVKLADFGLARLSGSRTTGERREIRGKASYMAPEVAFGGAPEPQSDLFGVGAILYELAAGVPPLPPVAQIEAAIEQARRCMIPPVAELVPELHPALAHVIDHALSAPSVDRIESAAAMEDALLRIATTLGLDPGPRAVGAITSQVLGPRGASASEVPRTLVATPAAKRRAKARSAILWLLGGFAAVAIGATTWGLLHTSHPEENLHPGTAEAGEMMPSVPDAGGINAGPASDSRDSGFGAVPSSSDSVNDASARAIAVDAGHAPRQLIVEAKPRHGHEPRPVDVPDAGFIAAASDPDPAAVPPPADPGPPPTVVAATESFGFSVRTNRTTLCGLDRRPDLPCPIELAEPLQGAHVLKLQDQDGLKVVVRIEEERATETFRLAFQSEPFAILSIDDQPRGLTPLAGLRIAKGPHVVTLAIPEHRPLVIRLALR